MSPPFFQRQWTLRRPRTHFQHSQRESGSNRSSSPRAGCRDTYFMTQLESTRPLTAIVACSPSKAEAWHERQCHENARTACQCQYEPQMAIRSSTMTPYAADVAWRASSPVLPCRFALNGVMLSDDSDTAMHSGVACLHGKAGACTAVSSTRSLTQCLTLQQHSKVDARGRHR